MNISDELKKEVWERGKQILDNAPEVWRKDDCGAIIKFNEHGNRKSGYGWEIDHIKPESDGGSDDIKNLRPLHWRNNAHKSDGKLGCVVTSKGNQNCTVS